MGSRRVLHRKLRRDLRRQATPFAAVVATVLLGVALFGASYDAYRNLTGSYDRVFDDLDVADVWVTGGDTGAIATEVAAVDGVARAATRVEVDLPMRVDGHKLAGRVVGLTSSPVVNDVYVLDGKRPDVSVPRGVLAEDHLASAFGLESGATVEVLVAGQWRPLEVTGRASSGEYLWLARDRQDIVAFPDEFGVVFAPDAAATAITGTAANQVLVRTTGGRSAGAVVDAVERIGRAHGATDVYTLAEQPSNAALSEDITGFSQMALLFPILFLTAAAMASYTLLSRRIHTERSIIGMLRAQGVSRSVIQRHYLLYGIVAGLAGAVPGILLGLWLARLMTRFYVGFLSLPITAVRFHPETPVIGVVFGLVAGGLAALAPARAAATVPPAEAMRGVVPASGGRRTLFEQLVPWSSHLSASSRLVLRSISRSRRRTAMTIGGVMLALLLVLVSWSMLDTVQGNLDAQFGARDRSDAQVAFAEVTTPEDLPDLGAVEGVTAVEPLASLPVSIRRGDASYTTILQALPADSSLRTFDVTSGDPNGLSAHGLLAGDALRSQLSIGVGDTVEVVFTDETGRAIGTARTPVVGFVNETLGTLAFTSLEDLAGILGVAEPPVTGALLGFEPGADGDAVRNRIEAVAGVSEYRSSDSLRELMDNATALLVGFVTLMLAAGGVLAAAMIFTTASVSISERANEVATLRASGVALGRIARLITAENLIVTALGVGPGIVLGILGGRAMMASYTTDQFAFDFLVLPRTIVASATAIMAVAGLSQVPGIRALRALDIAETVRQQSA